MALILLAGGKGQRSWREKRTIAVALYARKLEVQPNWGVEAPFNKVTRAVPYDLGRTTKSRSLDCSRSWIAFSLIIEIALEALIKTDLKMKREMKKRDRISSDNERDHSGRLRGTQTSDNHLSLIQEASDKGVEEEGEHNPSGRKGYRSSIWL